MLLLQPDCTHAHEHTQTGQNIERNTVNVFGRQAVCAHLLPCMLQPSPAIMRSRSGFHSTRPDMWWNCRVQHLHHLVHQKMHLLQVHVPWLVLWSAAHCKVLIQLARLKWISTFFHNSTHKWRLQWQGHSPYTCCFERLSCTIAAVP